MAQNSVRRACEESVALFAKKKLDKVIIPVYNWKLVEQNILDLLPAILDQMLDVEVQAQLVKYVITDPYKICNGITKPYFQTSQGLLPPASYNCNDVQIFIRDELNVWCANMRSRSIICNIIPGIIAKKIYKLYRPYTGRMNPKTCLPIQSSRKAYVKLLNDFQNIYFNMDEEKRRDLEKTKLEIRDLEKTKLEICQQNYYISMLKKLQSMVESEIWKGDPQMTDYICNSYCNIVQKMSNFDLPAPSNFGTSAFWTEVLNECEKELVQDNLSSMLSDFDSPDFSTLTKFDFSTENTLNE